MFEWLIRSQTPAPVVLDEAYLMRLERHVGPEALRELLADGMLELADKLDNLADQAIGTDVKQIAKICHDIAGAAGNLGLTEMTQMAVDANRQALREDPPAAEMLVQSVTLCRVPAMEALNTFCQTHANRSLTDENASETHNDGRTDGHESADPA